MLQAQEGGTGDFAWAGEQLNRAVEGLREGSRQDYLPRAFVARAVLYRQQKEFSKAWSNLEEAREIAERGGMKLYLADYHLEACRVCLDERKKEEAREHLDNARKLIEETGYHRRDREVGEMEERLEGKE